MALLAIVDFFEIGIDHLGIGSCRFRCRGFRAGSGTGFGLRRLIDRLAELERGRRQCFLLFSNHRVVFAFKRGAQFGDGRGRGFLVRRRNLVTGFFDGPLGRVDQPLRIVAEFDQLAPFLILIGMEFGVLDHLVDLGIAEPDA